MKLRLKLLMASIVAAVAGFAAVPLVALATHSGPPNNTVVVKLADLDPGPTATAATNGSGKWFMYNDTTDTIDNTLGSFVVGPGTPPNGVGSIEFTLAATPNDRKNIATFKFSGTKLADITKMSFAAYSHGGSGGAGPTESPYLNFNVDFNGSGAFQRRLVYVPSANGAVPQDAWNTYDTINGGNALWTWSGYANGPNGAVGGGDDNTWPDGNTSQYRTWSAINTAFPSARLLPLGGWLGIRVGEPGPTGYIGNVDFFKLGTASGTTTYDFEPTVGPPVTKAECKNGGWKTFTNPSFKNQGKCVDYVQKHADKIKGNVKFDANGLLRRAEFDVNSADGGGKFKYSDVNGDWYKVNVSAVSATTDEGWFAGVVTSASQPSWVGNWVFVKVHDGSPDQIWGSFTTQALAEAGVAAMTDPADGPFTVTTGNLKVN